MYLFLNEWEIFDLFDIKIFININSEIAYERLAKRHVLTGVTQDVESALKRIKNSDSINRDYLLKNSYLNPKSVIFYDPKLD